MLIFRSKILQALQHFGLFWYMNGPMEVVEVGEKSYFSSTKIIVLFITFLKQTC